jgi:hypothetical protein
MVTGELARIDEATLPELRRAEVGFRGRNVPLPMRGEGSRLFFSVWILQHSNLSRPSLCI